MSAATMNQPTFLVIGAQKAATTWLARALEKHPEVFTPERKELHYFDLKANHAQGPGWYARHFAGADAPGVRAVGECTPNYLWVTSAVPPEVEAAGLEPSRYGAQAYPDVNDDIPALVRRELPDAKLVVILRDPVARTVSSFHHHVRRRRLPPWSRLLEVGDRYGIVPMSFYDMHLDRWFECFDPERVLVLGFEDEVIPEPEATLGKVFRHIGVDDTFVPEGLGEKKNERASDPFLYANYVWPTGAEKLFGRFPRLHDLERPRVVVTADEWKTLRTLFAPGVERLEKRLGRSFIGWR